jgi:hypothetical protein
MTENYLLIDDLLDEKESSLIEKQMYDSFFPWYFTNAKDENGNMYTVGANTYDKWKNDENVIDAGQFVHMFLKEGTQEINSDYTKIPFKIISEFAKKAKINIDFSDILKLKANLITQYREYTKNSFGVPHTDNSCEHYVLIYYVNDSDGDTVLFNENKEIFAKITPKKGRCLFFNGSILHAGGHPVDNFTRCVINMNFKKND